MSVHQAAPCIVLAGGLGTRLRSAVPDLPKCLAPIGDRPFLDVQLTALADRGVQSFVLSLGHLSDLVVRAGRLLEHRLSIHCVTEPQALGTGGAVLFAMNAIGANEALVANGDTFLSGDLTAMLEPLDAAAGEALRMAVVRVEDRLRYGGVERSGRAVTGFLEKGLAGAGVINAGFYRVGRSAFAERAPGDRFSLEADVMPGLARSGRLTSAEIDGYFIDIGIPEDYARFCVRQAGA